MAVLIDNTSQIIKLAAADTLTRERMPVESLYCRGTAGGTFAIVIDGMTVNVTTTTNVLVFFLPLNRSVNVITLTSGPTGAELYVFLKKAT